MGWHRFGMRVNGVLALFFMGEKLEDEEFYHLTRYGLPPGWVAWHEGCDEELLRKRPLITVHWPQFPVLGWDYADWREELNRFIREKEAQAKAATELVGTS